MRTRILVVAADTGLRASLARWLMGAGYGVELAESPKRAREVLAGEYIPLAVVEADGLGPAGANFVSDLAGSVGHVVLVGDPAVDAAEQLATITDGCIAKPAEEQEVLARVNAVLQVSKGPDESTEPQFLRVAQFTMDLWGRECRNAAGELVPLTRAEFSLLAAFARAPGRVLSRDELNQVVTGRGAEPEDNSVYVLISRLRRKIEADPKRPQLIVTVPGEGYKLNTPVHATDDEAAKLGVQPAWTEVEVARPQTRPALPDRPSIAVLPFENMSDDPGQEYFADGMAEDIITALCRIPRLFVIARNSSFAYKGRPVDVRQVGRELGVRYILEGSVRKAAQRVRITGQLIDASTGRHLWADRFDGPLEDVFDLQDRVTASVVGAIAPKLEQAEIERAERKPTDSLDAYDYFLRGLAHAHQLTRPALDEALRLYTRSIELDPTFAAPHGAAAFCYVLRKMNGWIADPAGATVAAVEHAQRAAQQGKDDAAASALAGLALGYVAGELDEAAALTERSLALNGNLAIGWYSSGTIKAFRGGEADVAIEHLARAMRLSPLDPLMFTMQGVTAVCHFFAGRYDQAISWTERAFRNNPEILGTLRIGAASNALAGRDAEAMKFITRALKLDPEMRVSNLPDRIGIFRRQEDRAKYIQALRRAGLPD
jgi:TolB-like protein/DNA-binding response OmpR family regulator